MAYTRKISASQINLYHECPRKYFYKYILKIKEPAAIALTKGSFAHSIVETFFTLNPRDCNINLRNYKTEFYNYGLEIFNKVLNEPRNYFGKPLPSYKDELTAVCDGDLFEYAKALADIKKYMNNWITLYIMQFEGYTESAKGFAQAYYMSCPARNELEIKHPKFTGYIDEVINKNDMIIVRDLKSSKIYKCAHSEEYELQLNLYCYGYNYMYDVVPDIGSVWFMRYGIEALYKFDKKNIISDMELLIESFYDTTESHDILTYPCNYDYQFCTCKASQHTDGFKDGKFRCFYEKYCDQEIDGFDINYEV